MIPLSLTYKLVLDGEIVAEGNKADMRRKLRQIRLVNPFIGKKAFIGYGSQNSQLGQKWGAS